MMNKPNDATGFFLLCCLLLLFVHTVEASLPQHVKANLIADVESIKPGSRFSLAVVLTMKEGWHTYWKNPGDSGLPTTIEWNLPEGFLAGEIQWPYPQKFETSGIVSFGYADKVVLLIDMQAPAALNPGTVVKLSARVNWLACKEECVPEHSDLIIELPVDDRDSEVGSKWADIFEMSRGNLPKSFKDWDISAFVNGNKIVIQALTNAPVNRPSMTIFFFPEEEGIVEHAEPQTVEKQHRGYSIEITRSKFSSNLPSRLKGILYSPKGWDASGLMHALLVDVPLKKKGINSKKEVVR
jgi:thiol:disulfide interchange protein DsbD